MKKLFLILIPALLLSSTVSAQNIPAAPDNKAVVYFARTSSMGFAINFTYFDSTSVIGRTNGANYIRYECEPGKHLFWGRSENRDFVEADIEAGKIYFIEVVPLLGAIKAGVALNPADPANEKIMKRIFKLLAKEPAQTFSPEQLQAEKEKFKEVIERGMEKYAEEKAAGKEIKQLTSDMYYKE